MYASPETPGQAFPEAARPLEKLANRGDVTLLTPIRLSMGVQWPPRYRKMETAKRIREVLSQPVKTSVT